MKISKFNESGEFHKMMDEKFPIRCKMKNRIPDPGICWVTKIDFNDRNIHWVNGRVSSIANFDNVEFLPDIFVFNKYNI